jgi:hypothetical protein
MPYFREPILGTPYHRYFDGHFNGATFIVNRTQITRPDCVEIARPPVVLRAVVVPRAAQAAVLASDPYGEDPDSEAREAEPERESDSEGEAEAGAAEEAGARWRCGGASATAWWRTKERQRRRQA